MTQDIATHPEHEANAPSSIMARIVHAMWRVPSLAFALAVGFVRLFWNPILTKELTVSSRRKRTYFLRTAHLSLLIVVLFFVWRSIVGPQFSATQELAERLQSESQAGQALSVGLGWLQLVALIIIAPILTASCIADEVEDRTINVLLTTPLNAAQIVVGKLLSRLVHVMLLIALSAPVLLAMQAYGGFDFQILMRVEVLCMTSAFLGAAIGTFLSCWEMRNWRAATGALIGLALYWGLMPALLAYLVTLTTENFGGLIVFGASANVLPDWMAVIVDLAEREEAWIYVSLYAALSPVATMMVLTIEELSGGLFGSLTDTLWWIVNSVNVGLALTLVLAAIPATRRRARMTQAGEFGSSASLFGWARPLFGRVRSLFRFVFRRESKRAIEPVQTGGVADWNPASLRVPKVWQSPVLWREFRLRMQASPSKRFISGIAIALLLWWYYAQAKPWEDLDMQVLLIFPAMALQLFLAAVASTTTIVQEKQAQTWETLLCTPISPFQLLFQKMLGVLKRTAVPGLILLMHLTVFSWFFYSPWALVLQACFITFGFVVLVSASGILFSLITKRVLTSMVCNLTFVIALWGGLPLVSAMLIWLTTGSESSEWLAGAFACNPFYWMGVACAPLFRDVTEYQLFNFGGGEPPLSVREFTTACGALFAINVGVSIGILAALAGAFNRITGRSS